MSCPPPDPPPPRLTARHYVAAHLSEAVELLAQAYEEAHDAAEPCARPVRIVIHGAHVAAMHALDVLRSTYYLDGAPPPDTRPEGIGTAGRSYDEGRPPFPTGVRVTGMEGGDRVHDFASGRTTVTFSGRERQRIAAHVLAGTRWDLEAALAIIGSRLDAAPTTADAYVGGRITETREVVPGLTVAARLQPDGSTAWTAAVDPARPVAGAKLRAAVNTPSARAVGRASVYAGSPPLAPFRRAIDREMVVARERMEAEALGRPLTPRPALWFRPLPRLASWATRVADRIDWPRCVPGYTGWRRLRARVSSILHNAVAHPLLELWPRSLARRWSWFPEDPGGWLHDHTTPLGPEVRYDVGMDLGHDTDTAVVMATPLDRAGQPSGPSVVVGHEAQDAKLRLAREGLTPRQADQVRDMATRSTPVTTGDLRPSIQLTPDHLSRAAVVGPRVLAEEAAARAAASRVRRGQVDQG